ncbi:MAG: hypothetical protein M1497_08300 [Nitrospirae bacterium]|nr:hypothetical protein [Nitrospirota bacterium]
MPHAGLMDVNALGPEAGSLQRARLHIRGGRRRLRQGKIPEGLVTLYDAMNAALEWYFASPERRRGLLIKEKDNLKDEKVLFEILTRSGVLDGTFDYREFDELVERVIYTDSADFDYERVLEGIEAVMVQLGVMPFEENALPKEDPSTF